ncbi:ricin-type beta-trefoil lectin domain protein [Kitasatospora sp. YST-16]|uniref:RICIN domain-containing protein n=1 Tax=Kitasatospora sp. YST-16 TaxID=2998080 RepID=UPI0022847E2E|nr:RICIN domain-containing protein [Kitasatospora sp. YST-16]WAL75891.1 ricin-type beta-trefoil lectin domain protein [Kitasatospora sp. YST-16]WNW41952.1 ricin-type beta-trefoil lectin domain protein [Streptomyces sp. Li-HN-5-13]
MIRTRSSARSHARPHARPRTALRAAAAAVALPATVAGLLVAGAGPASAAANAGPGFPAHYAAPYLETWNSPNTLADARNSGGLKYATLAFVISDGSCNATFNGNTPITDAGWTNAINAHRAAGGDVIASFGGASGTELGQACTSVSTLQAQYKRVVDALNLTRIDLDVEGGALNDTAANDRRNQALAQLQQAQAAAGKRLDVNYTLPVSPSGLESNSISLLNNAKSRGLTVNAVNIMTMDYGSPMDMGQAAISAANGLHTQLSQIWTSKTSDQLWAMEGNTPMIGVNDTTSEVFSTANAQTLESFAASKGIQLLAFWALGRDKACASNGTLSDTCSGTPQSAYQFAKTFNQITGGSTTPPTGGRTGQITGYGGKCVDVAAASSANGTAVQLYDCNGTAAQQWTVGTDGTVRALGKCLDLTSGGTANGTQAQLYDCNGTGAQQWQAQANKTLVNPASGRCLDATGPSSANGTRLQVWDCFGGANQQWNLPA